MDNRVSVFASCRIYNSAIDAERNRSSSSATSSQSNSPSSFVLLSLFRVTSAHNVAVFHPRSNSSSSLSNTSSTSTNNTTLILSILFGVLLGLVFFTALIFCIVRRMRNRRDQRERQFRLGNTSSSMDPRQHRGSEYTPAETPMRAIENPTPQTSLFSSRASNAKFDEAHQEQLQEQLNYHHSKSLSGRLNAAKSSGAEENR